MDPAKGSPSTKKSKTAVRTHDDKGDTELVVDELQALQFQAQATEHGAATASPESQLAMVKLFHGLQEHMDRRLEVLHDSLEQKVVQAKDDATAMHERRLREFHQSLEQKIDGAKDSLEQKILQAKDATTTHERRLKEFHQSLEQKIDDANDVCLTRLAKLESQSNEQHAMIEMLSHQLTSFHEETLQLIKALNWKVADANSQAQITHTLVQATSDLVSKAQARPAVQVSVIPLQCKNLQCETDLLNILLQEERINITAKTHIGPAAHACGFVIVLIKTGTGRGPWGDAAVVETLNSLKPQFESGNAIVLLACEVGFDQEQQFAPSPTGALQTMLNNRTLHINVNSNGHFQEKLGLLSRLSQDLFVRLKAVAKK